MGNLEYISKANSKLRECNGWKSVRRNSYSLYQRYTSDLQQSLYIHDPNSIWLDTCGCIYLYYHHPNESIYLSLANLESIFDDPFNISREEAELFRLEHGFEYPKELINDL